MSSDLRVRSQPRVADDSIKYEPLLPTGTELTVCGGPVSASGYTWYEVIPVDVTLQGGHTSGWVAAADKDGAPWIALPSTAAAGAKLAMSSVARAPADPAKAKEAAASITAFGLDLYKRMLVDPKLDLADKGVVFSPTSIALALGMARAGANGETATEMDKVLHVSGWDQLGPGLNALDQALTSRNATWEDPGADPPSRSLQLRVANASFAQGGWDIVRSYLDGLAAVFGSGLHLVDYRTDPEAARQTINAWVSDQTKGRIPNLLGPDALDQLTRIVLVNAIFLKAGWELEFDARNTGPAAFARLDGSKTDVQTMFRYGAQTIPYVRGTGWQATEIRYLGDRWTTPLALTLIRPDDLRSFEAALTARQLERITAALARERTRLEVITPGTSGEMCDMGTYPYAVELYLPRFGIDTKAQLADVLKALGMPLAVTRGVADFSGIHVPKSYEEILYIQSVIHQANIDVDEEGTEAAAATALGMGATGGGCVGTDPLPRKTITLRLDRPFLFVLHDVETGAVLFMGRVVDPTVRG